MHTSDVIGNLYLSKNLLEGKDLLNNGASISESLENGGAFPKMLIQSIKVGEESGSVDKILKKHQNFMIQRQILQ